MAENPSARETPAGLRGAIEQGRSGDKKPGFDPAAAPLETDAEASGSPMTGAMAGEAAASQHHPDRSDYQGSRAEAMRAFDPKPADRRGGGPLLIAAVVVAIVIVAVVAALWSA